MIFLSFIKTESQVELNIGKEYPKAENVAAFNSQELDTPHRTRESTISRGYEKQETNKIVSLFNI